MVVVYYIITWWWWLYYVVVALLITFFYLFHTHTHTPHTHTHTHKKCLHCRNTHNKYLQTHTASRDRHPHTQKVTSCIGTVLQRAKKLFARVSSGRTIFEDDFKREIVCAKLFHAAHACQTLAYMIAGAHQLLCRFCHFSVATW